MQTAALAAATLVILAAATLGSFLSGAGREVLGALVWGLGAIAVFGLSLIVVVQRERIARIARQAQALARSDPLTGLPSRRVPEERGGWSVPDLLDAAEASLEEVSSKQDCVSHRLEMPRVAEGAVDDCAESSELTDHDAGKQVWPVLRPLVLSCTMAAAILGGWFGLAELIDPDLLRPALTALALAAGVWACLTAARAASGRERYGWALVAAGLATWFVPFAGPLAGAAGACGLLVMLSGRWLSDRYRLLDVAGVLFSVSAFAAALLVPHLVELGTSELTLVASRISAGVLGTALVTSAVVAFYWIPLRARPDAMFVALGYLVAVVATAPWALTDEGWLFAPASGGEVAVALAVSLIATGALLRAVRGVPSLEAVDLETRTLDGSTAGNLLLIAVAGILIHGGAIDAAAVVGLLLGVIVVRDMRSRLLERDRRNLRRSALHSRRELLMQCKANLLALSRALTARDGYTGKHSVATLDLAVRVACRLELSREAVREVEIVALLHDIGKIGVPDEILRAPRALNEEEWRVMREHPVIGERILSAVPGLEQVARSVRHEHERWDGTGYPDGLSGQSIPVPSRIVLACDAFDAIASGRPYRPARTRHEGMAELQRGAGSQFDPAVVHTLLDELLAEEQEAERRRGRFARRERPPARTPAERAEERERPRHQSTAPLSLPPGRRPARRS